MRLSRLSDEELMKSYQSGSEEAFRELYGRHSEKVYGYLRKKVWNQQRASELFQEVFLKLHKSKHLYDVSLPYLPWLFSIVRSVLVDGLRADRTAKANSESVDSPVVEVTAAVSSIELLPHLPEMQRKAVELRYVDEKSYEEIATALQTSSQNARKLVSRAVVQLRELGKGRRG